MTARRYWLDTMLRISEPVLTSLQKHSLHDELPMIFHPERYEYALLEALGRTLTGMAPWLELEEVADAEEKALQSRYRELAVTAISNAVDPKSPDYMNFDQGYGQALVDAAFLAHGIVRSPKQLYQALTADAKANLVRALKATRKFVPFPSNWLLFSAMVETALFVMGEEYDPVRVEYAVRSFENWYVGDGTYGDGSFFHWDYYNSFVIHPMYVDIMATFRDKSPEYQAIYEKVMLRASRYAAIQEQLINADGSYPVFGRSVTYRFGAFHALAQAAQEHYLPQELPAAQVRSALTAVIRKVTSYPTMFDEKGWLMPGVCGNQPDLAEGYICVGSLYLCNAVFLPLGLPESDPFWSGEDCDWTAKRIWNGQNTSCDHAID